MKSIFLCLTKLLLFVATASQANEKRILTSLYPIHIAALNITAGADEVQVECLSPPSGGCLHDHQMSADDMVRISKADILIVNGLGAESFLGNTLARFPKLKVITASEGVDPIEEGGEVNPHAWLGVAVHIGQVQRIAEGLAEADPANAEKYRANAAGYVGRLEALRGRFSKGLQGIASREIATFHDAFPYFAREFGFAVVAVIQRHPGSEPGAQELKDTIIRIRRQGVRVIFAEPQYPVDSAKVVAAETGARVLMLDPVVSGPSKAGAYVEAMDRNLAVLMDALGPKVKEEKEGEGTRGMGGEKNMRKISE